MIPIGMTVAICVVMSKIADAEGRSSLTWGVITLALCLASFAIPLPFLNVMLAGVVAFILLLIVKLREGR